MGSIEARNANFRAQLHTHQKVGSHSVLASGGHTTSEQTIIIKFLNHFSRQSDKIYLENEFHFHKRYPVNKIFKKKKGLYFMKQFCVPEELMNKINMAKGDHLELHTTGNLCIFNYDRSSFDSEKVAKELTSHIQEILEKNQDYKITSTNNNPDLNLIFVVFDSKN